MVYPPRGGDESGANIQGRRKVRRGTTRAGGYRGLLERKRNNEKWPLTLGLPPVVAGGTFAIVPPAYGGQDTALAGHTAGMPSGQITGGPIWSPDTIYQE